MRLFLAESKKIALVFLSSIVITSFVATAQTNINSSGNWDNSGIWSAGIPSGIGSDVTWSSNKNVTFPNSTAYSTTSTIGNITINNSDGLTIGDGTATNVNLILGASGTPKSFTDQSSTGNSASITVMNGATLEIWGDLVVNNHLSLDVQTGGTLIIHGSVTVANNATIDVAGGVTVGGDFTVGNSGQINVAASGSVSVTGNVTAGNATCANIQGTFTTGGSCSGGGASCSTVGGTSGVGFCTALPISLLMLQAKVSNQTVELKWSTVSELNFDHFVLERSANGTQFSELAKIKGSGNSNTRKNYSYTDSDPFIGNSYYRLTSIDFDGYTEVFNNNIVRVTVKAEKDFNVAPNPIQGFNLKGRINFDASVSQVIIYDKLGTSLGKFIVSGPEIDVQLPSLNNGIYFAQIQSDGFTKTVRFVVNQ